MLLVIAFVVVADGSGEVGWSNGMVGVRILESTKAFLLFIGALYSDSLSISKDVGEASNNAQYTNDMQNNTVVEVG